MGVARRLNYKMRNKIEIGIKRRLRSLKRIEKYIIGKDILDVGCKTGATTEYFSKKGFNVTGIDINQKWINFAKDHYPKSKFLLKDIIDEKGIYDTILVIGVLEEIPITPKVILKKLKKNLNKNGRVIIEVRNTNSIKRRIKTLFGLEPIDPFNVRFWCFTKKRLEEVFFSTGYKILKIMSNNWDSFRHITIPTPDCCSEEIWVVGEPISSKP